MSSFVALRDHFADSLPELKRIARAAFSRLDPEAREEAVQNTIGLAWKQYRRLILRGRGEEPGILRSALAFAVKQTRCGRMVQGQARAKDVAERHRRGKLRRSGIDLDGFIGRATPVPDQVSFRIDTPQLLANLSPRQQGMAGDLMAGLTTGEVARKHKVSPAAVSQFRTRFKALYDRFFGV